MYTIESEQKKSYWKACSTCKGQGKNRRRVRKKVRLQYARDLAAFSKMDATGKAPVRPQGSLVLCPDCKGTGLFLSDNPPEADHANYPHIAIIGAGIGGVALAIACLHRSIPFTLYERDHSFDARSQGYGLTIQQATKAIKGLGLGSLVDGVISTRHVVHTTDGEIVGEWGMRKWVDTGQMNTPKRTNIHIARQALRLALLEELGGSSQVEWGHQLIDYSESKTNGVDLSFQVDGEIRHAKADVLVGADGIRSTVRKKLIGELNSPLRYLGCIVILGICPLASLDGLEHSLLDSATVFQTANGLERIYMMPYSEDTIMWQLSFPMSEDEAKKLSEEGAHALKEEACKRTRWHDPIPQIMSATDEALISGYPVYDRALLQAEWLQKGNQTTLIGDAAHPMSPFKGQGANQALLDALGLARAIAKTCGPQTKWREEGVKNRFLRDFENEMIERSASKVKDSAAAVDYLHSEHVLLPANAPRGRFLKEKSD